MAAKMPTTMRMQALEYAAQLGLAFQIQDDILDVTGDEAVFGNPIGSDREEGKVTFVDLKGIEGCRQEVAERTARAKSAIASWGDRAFLLELADHLVSREK